MTISVFHWFFILTVALSAFLSTSKLETKTTTYDSYYRPTRVPLASDRN
jgi:hypothetical protein